MALSIIAKGSQAPAHAPVFGHLVHTEKMEFAYRATSSQNSFDLSDNEYALSKVGDCAITKFGLINTNTIGGLQVANKFELSTNNFDSYTIMGVISANNLNASNGSTSNCTVFTDFKLNVPGSALVITANSGNFVLRAIYGGVSSTNQNTASNLFSNLTIPSDCFDATNLKPIFVAASISSNSINNIGENWVGIVSHPDFLNVGSSIVKNGPYTLPASGRNFFAADKKAFTANTPSNVYIGNTMEELFPYNRSQQIKEVRLDSQFFNLQMIEDQYQATKKWLLAEGVLDISHWR